VHGGGGGTGWEGDGNLGVVNAREVAGASRLVLLRLEREGVRVHTWVRAARVVVVGLDLVEVLTLLGLEAVLAVEDELELGERTSVLLSPLHGGAILTTRNKRNTRRESGRDVAVTGGLNEGIGLKDNVTSTWVLGEVPKRGGNVRGRRVVEAPHELLDWVVVGEALVLGSAGRGHGVRAGVLHLLDEVLVTLLGEAAALLGVKVDVVGPDLEGVGVEVGAESVSKIEINTDLVVLEGNEREEKTWIAVEKEDERKVDSVASGGSGHLTPVSLLGLIKVKLGVETPPALVGLVNTLTTDGKLGRSDGTLSDPVGIITVGGAGVSRGRLELNVHVTDKITVAGNSHGDATRGSGGTVNSLLDVLHREVSVALVDRLEESNLRVTSEVHILGTVSDELHKTTGHFESFCTIYREKNFGCQTRGIFDFEFSQSRLKCRHVLKRKNLSKRLKRVRLLQTRRVTRRLFSPTMSMTSTMMRMRIIWTSQVS
jgi:hypothetical protein